MRLVRPSQPPDMRASHTAPSEDDNRGSRRLASLRGDYYLPHYDLWKWRHSIKTQADILHPGANVVVLGSCFADEMVEYLGRRSYNARTHPAGELYNAEVLRVELEHVLTGLPWPFEIAVATPDGIEHRLRKRCTARSRDELLALDAKMTQDLRASLAAADVVIVIAGTTAELWRSAETGLATNTIPHPAIYARGGWNLDPGQLDRICSDIKRIQDLLSEHTDAHQVYTVCPIPLYATWLDVPVAPANGRSKALLRTALDLSLSEQSIYLDLWEWVHAQIGRRVPVMADGRHFTATGLDQIMLFAEKRLSARRVPRLSIRHRIISRLKTSRLRINHSRPARLFRRWRRSRR